MSNEKGESLGSQERIAKISGRLISVFSSLSANPNLDFISGDGVVIPMKDGRSLFEISPQGLQAPPLEVLPNIFERISRLPDDFVSDAKLALLVKGLREKGGIQRLNHLGLCYLVDSKEDERKKIASQARDGWHLYEEPSTGDSLWLFLGDRSNWKDPMLELLPIEATDDKWIDLWLPHFQIDIDTGLNPDQARKLIRESSGGKVQPYDAVVADNGYVCIVRARLGVEAGLNINLDIGTEGRWPKHQRETLLKEVELQ